MQARLHGIPTGDLVAIEATYHGTPASLSTFLNKRSISASRTKAERDASSSNLGHAMDSLVEEFRPGVESGGVYLLKTLRDRYRELRKEIGAEGTEKYRPHTLQEMLIKAWPQLSFIQQPATSGLVCSMHITVGEALRQASSPTRKRYM